jgi:hypothetical protein
MAVKEKVKSFDKTTATGTRRHHAIEEQGMGDMFKDMTPREKGIGHLLGKLIDQNCRTFNQIEEAFTWFEVEHNKGVQLNWTEKKMIIIQAAATLDCDQANYNLIRKMYLTVANRS